MGFNTSLSGLRAANTDLNVTANNIANANTTGFKGSRAEFADQFTLNGYGLARNAVGSGVRVSNVAQQFSQGTIDPTGRSLDLAISGSGFFTLSNNGARVYSRAGNFQTDANGYVVNPQGARLQVFPPASNGNGFAVGTLSDLQLLTTDSPPKQTGTVNLTFTLPGNTQPPTVTTFNPNDANSYNNSSGGTTVYDSLGVAHVQTSYFVKTSTPNQWTVYNYVDGVAAGGASTLQFSNSGALVSPADGNIPLGSFTPATGAGTLSLTLNVFGSTQYGEAFALRGATQDGYASGKLNSISIDEKGIVYARYSNNADKALGQIAVTNFVNPQGLSSLGDNAWAESSASGIARTGSPATSDFGSVQSGSLESSTVDLTEQLVNMIVAQRNFQANSQVISTQDQVTQTIINMR